MKNKVKSLKLTIIYLYYIELSLPIEFMKNKIFNFRKLNFNYFEYFLKRLNQL